MRKTIINGVPIPYETETTELINMLSSGDMTAFSVACEALSFKKEEQAFDALASMLNLRDKYRRLYVFKVIYRHPESSSLEQYLSDQLRSDDYLFVSAALHNIVDYRIACPQEVIKAAILQNYNRLYDEFEALRQINTNEENYRYLENLLTSVNQSNAQEIIADILIERYNSTNGDELVQLLAASSNPKLRVRAVALGKERGIDMSDFLNDPDGHVRKACDNC